MEVDGVTLAVGDRVLLAGQENGAENGVYVADGAGGLSRASDFDSAGEIDGGAHLFIQEGVEAGQGYVLGDLGENFELGKDASGNPEKTYSRSKGWINLAESNTKFAEV
mgnify:CR=1 FL=1